MTPDSAAEDALPPKAAADVGVKVCCVMLAAVFEAAYAAAC